MIILLVGVFQGSVFGGYPSYLLTGITSAYGDLDDPAWFSSNLGLGALAQPNGFFEGEVPLRGTYLQTINCYPSFGRDENDDGVMDPGFTWDFDGDGVKETTYMGEDPLIIDLEAHGFYPGDMIMISHRQSLRTVIWNQWYAFNLFGLFSSSPVLLKDNWDYTPSYGDLKWPMIGPRQRVPGAIDAALGNFTHGPFDDTNTWKQGREVENDIPEDFEIRPIRCNTGKPGIQWTEDTWAFQNYFWIKIPPGAKYLFVQRVAFWLLDHDGYIKITIEKDTDGDALPDTWETRGVDWNKDDKIDLKLPDMGARYDHKDIFVEVDYMENRPFVLPAQRDVERAFSNAPVDIPKGIDLHIEVDEVIPYKEDLNLDNSWTEFYELKEQYYGTGLERTDPVTIEAKRRVFRYCLFINHFAKFNDTSSSWETSYSTGYGEVEGNDFIVSLGPPGLTDLRTDQSSTFMHELGHNLGLLHGGQDDKNYKPNYLSIMNYLFQFPYRVPGRPLDYSWSPLDTLDEDNLTENIGIPGPVNSRTAYTLPNGTRRVVFLNEPIDWDGDNTTLGVGVAGNINNMRGNSPSGEFLDGYSDWDKIVYRFADKPSFNDGAPIDLAEPEITTTQIEEMYREALNTHEVAIKEIHSPVEIDQNQSGINLTIANLGYSNETINIDLYANNTLLTQKTVQITGGADKNTAINFTTTVLGPGNYTLRILANPLQGETYTTDNALSTILSIPEPALLPILPILGLILLPALLRSR